MIRQDQWRDAQDMGHLEARMQPIAIVCGSDTPVGGALAARMHDSGTSVITIDLLGAAAHPTAVLRLAGDLAEERDWIAFAQDIQGRGLRPSMLAYAAADTRFLLALRDALEQQLQALGRLSWAQEEFKQLESLRWTGPVGGTDDETYLRLKGAKGLSPRSLAALRLLHRWRDTVAEREDKAPFRIIGNDALLGVARALPATIADLAHIKDLPRSLARRYGEPLLDAALRAKALNERELPRLERRPRLPKDSGFDARLERAKAVRNRVATELGLDPGVVSGRTALEAVVRARPANRAALEQVGGMRRWQIDVLGDALLEAVR